MANIKKRQKSSLDETQKFSVVLVMISTTKRWNNWFAFFLVVQKHNSTSMILHFINVTYLLSLYWLFFHTFSVYHDHWWTKKKIFCDFICNVFFILLTFPIDNHKCRHRTAKSHTILESKRSLSRFIIVFSRFHLFNVSFMPFFHRFSSASFFSILLLFTLVSSCIG